MSGSDGVYAGKYIGRHDYLVDESYVAEYMAATRDFHPWYTEDSPFGGPVAPALFLHDEPFRFPFDDWYLPNRYGNLHIRQDWELFRAVPVGTAVRTHAMVTERYIRKDRDVVVLECMAFDTEGIMVARSRCHQAFLLDQEARGTIVDRGTVTRARAETGDPAEPLEFLEPVERTVDLDLCMAYSGPARNYHNDPAEALKLGFPDVVVQGTLSTTFISEMLTHRFGRGWFEGGRCSLKLVNVLWGGETVIARGAIREITPEGAARRAHLDVWTEKPDGTKTIAGSASALID